MFLVFVMLGGIDVLHSSFIPIALIRLSAAKPTFLERFGPPTISWFSTLFAGLAGAVIYGLLKGEISIAAWRH